MKVGVETGSQLPSPPLVTFVTFTRLSRITLCALSHKFNLVFPLPFFPRRFPGLRFQMPADSDCVYRVCNGQSGAAFVCFKYSLIKLDFRNFKSTEPASLVAAHCFGKQLYCVLWFSVVSDTINNACHRDDRAGLTFSFLKFKCTKCLAVSVSL